MRTGSAQVGFTSLVDIKTPSTQLLQTKKYRNGAFPPSIELAGSVAQAQANCYRWANEGSQTPRNIAIQSSNRFMTVMPRAYLVVGHTKELTDEERTTCFELFRRGLGNLEVITYDELLERAKSLVGMT